MPVQHCQRGVAGSPLAAEAESFAVAENQHESDEPEPRHPTTHPCAGIRNPSAAWGCAADLKAGTCT